MRSSAWISFLMLCGVALGAVFGHFYLYDPIAPIGPDHWTKELGTLILIRPLLLVAMPVAFLGLILAVDSIGHFARLGLVGGALVIYFLASMGSAAIIGVAAGTLLRPGEMAADRQTTIRTGAEGPFRESEAAGEIEALQRKNAADIPGMWQSLLRDAVPTNIFSAFAKTQPLGIMLLGLLIGMALAGSGERSVAARLALEGLFDALLRVVGWLMWLAPIGTFMLVAWSAGHLGLQSLRGQLGPFVAITAGGLAVHGLVILPLLLAIFGRTNPIRFGWRTRKAWLVGFATASSASTLPAAIETSLREGACSSAAPLALTLGDAFNKCGTALFQATAVIFLCQLYGIDIDLSDLVIVVIAAASAAVGTAGLPSGALITLVIAINAINTSLASRGQATLPIESIGAIVGVDRVLDMCRTGVNVWGNLVGAKIISRLATPPS